MSGISRRALLRGAAAATVAAPAVAAAVVPVRDGIHAGFAQGGVTGIGEASVPAARIRWTPADYLDDEYVPHITDSPSEWLESLSDGGHRLLNRYGETFGPDDDVEPEALRRLVDGEVVHVDRYEDYGTAQLTAIVQPDDAAEELDRFTCSREWPAGAECVAEEGEPESVSCSLEDLADNALMPGESMTVCFFAWTSHRFIYRAATGTLEPVDPASLVPPMRNDGPQPELPLPGEATDA